ncbi:DUF1272 domain-containing protein [bacterium]|nr:DUF1272 domain-containing protein [bacterium]
MLELRPICEHCAKELPPASGEAMICSFECTFCRDCALGLLSNVCPNCGGGFQPRPIRPAEDHKGGNYLGRYPASASRLHRPVNPEEHQALLARLAGRPPEER